MEPSAEKSWRSLFANPVFYLLLLGFLFRVAWTFRHGLSFAFGEAPNTAIAFARTGTFADPFLPGSGISAHVTPITPAIAGLVYRCFGVRSSTSETILMFWSIGLVIFSFYCLYRAFLLAGLRRIMALGALFLLCILPININLETVWFRIWEGGVAVALGSAWLWALLALDGRAYVSKVAVAGLALMASLMLFIIPPLGLAAYLTGAILVVRRVPAREWLASVAIVGAISIAVLAPWTIRNELVFGKPIILRDNFGLEFAQANYPGALSPADPAAEYRRRHTEIHPYANPLVVEKMRAAGGEVPYFEGLGKTAKQWALDHPGSFIQLCFRHFRDTLFPPTWFWKQFSDAGSGTEIKRLFMWLTTIVALVGLVAGLLSRRFVYVYLLILTLVPILPYALVQPTLRYRYIVNGLIVFICFMFLDMILRMATNAFRKPAPTHTATAPAAAQ